MADAVDVSTIIASLPSNVQDAIKALVAQELAKNAPPPPKVLTPSEQASLHVTQAYAALQNDLNMANFNGHILSVLEMLVAKSYAADETVAPVAVTTVADASASEIGGAV